MEKEFTVVERISKRLCGATVRNRAPVISRITWSLFGLACLFVGARFVARPERLHGSGYGWYFLFFSFLFHFLSFPPSPYTTKKISLPSRRMIHADC